jgi:spore coat assemly protein
VIYCGGVVGLSIQVGDTVVRLSYGKDITFKITEVKESESGKVYILKGINIRIVADSFEGDLEVVPKNTLCEKEQILNRQVNDSIKKILLGRDDISKLYRASSPNVDKDLKFGRPGKVLHIDGDASYLDICMKVYKQLSIDVTGQVIAEKEQSSSVVQLVKQYKPDIVVITGHDSITKGTTEFMNIDNYRNSKYFINSVSELRNYQPDYDALVIFAGACQSYYEGILDAGANFASSPGRVLIHCLDPVFICQKVAYASIEKVVSIQEILSDTITGTKGIGGLQTRGKYREGFPKSTFDK